MHRPPHLNRVASETISDVLGDLRAEGHAENWLEVQDNYNRVSDGLYGRLQFSSDADDYDLVMAAARSYVADCQQSDAAIIPVVVGASGAETVALNDARGINVRKPPRKTGHAGNSGLQQHSLGEEYPYSVVVIDRNGFGVCEGRTLITGKRLTQHPYRTTDHVSFADSFENAHRKAEAVASPTSRASDIAGLFDQVCVYVAIGATARLYYRPQV